MISISLCMIVKNEKDTLSRCLDCVKDIVDEIIIVDTGSSDNTKEIAKRYTSKVYDYKWCDDFAKARNFSFSKATKEYILWLDADDVILEKDRENLKILKTELTRNTDMVMLKYNLGVDENGNPNLSFYRERLMKKTMNYTWVSPIHEVIVPHGNVIYKDIAITHKKEHLGNLRRNLKIFNKMKKEGYKFDARLTFYYARELMYNKKYAESIKQYLLFLDMNDGWLENKISACLDLAYIYEVLEKTADSLHYLLKTFSLDTPRAEVCCKIANHFMRDKKYIIAKYWLEQAINCEMDLTTGGFFNKDYYDFIPYISLSICYYYLNDISLAIKYNDMAGNIHPTHTSYIHNKKFYEESLNSLSKK